MDHLKLLKVFSAQMARLTRQPSPFMELLGGRGRDSGKKYFQQQLFGDIHLQWFHGCMLLLVYPHVTRLTVVSWVYTPLVYPHVT